MFVVAPMSAQMGGFGMPQQGGAKVKVDKDGIMKRLEKSDKEMDKKAGKATTWVNRGKVMLEAATAFSKNVYEGLNTMTAGSMFESAPIAQEEVMISGMPVTKITYTPEFIAYADAGGNIISWEFPSELVPNALAQAEEAYNKAYQLDSKTTGQVMAGLSSIMDELQKLASFAYGAGNYGLAGDYFKKAYEVSLSPVMLMTNDAALYNAGLAYFFADESQKSYEAFKTAAEAGFEQNGDVFYFEYQALKEVALAGGDEVNKEVLAPAKDMLMVGFEKYPENAQIIECLTDYYVSMGEDPASVIPLVEEAIAKTPDNAALWNGLGRIQNSQGDLDGAIASFEKVAELLPDNAAAHYSVGYLYISKADRMNREANEKTYSSQDEYSAALAGANAVYAKSIAPLEKAHELDPTDRSYVEYLRSVCFRLRDMEGIMDKYNKYNDLLKTM